MGLGDRRRGRRFWKNVLPGPPVLVPFGTFLALGQHLVAPGTAEVAVRARHPVVQVCVAPGVAPDAGH